MKRIIGITALLLVFIFLSVSFCFAIGYEAWGQYSGKDKISEEKLSIPWKPRSQLSNEEIKRIEMKGKQLIVDFVEEMKSLENPKHKVIDDWFRESEIPRELLEGIMKEIEESQYKDFYFLDPNMGYTWSQYVLSLFDEKKQKQLNISLFKDYIVIFYLEKDKTYAVGARCYVYYYESKNYKNIYEKLVNHFKNIPSK